MSALSRKRVVLAGGSGFLGGLLAQRLGELGYEPVVLSRSRARGKTDAQSRQWDGKTLGEWVASLEGAEAIVNLTGKSVDCRHTKGNRSEIISSRIDSVKVLARAAAGCATPPKTWVQSSSLAIYGDAGDRECHDDAPAGEGFAADVCKLWEGAFQSAVSAHMKPVVLRIGAVMGPDGVAMRKLLRLTKLFLGGTVGGGHQWISWLHPADMTEMLIWSIERPEIEGVFNATSPLPVTNAELMRELRRTVGRPWSPPTPAWAVRLGAGLLDTDAEIPLSGRKCLPTRFLEHGFGFDFPELRHALADALNQN